MTLERRSLSLLAEAADALDEGYRDLPPFEPDVDLDAMRPVLLEVARRMRDDFPFPHPMYAGQMLKPPLPIARLAYELAMWVNPNNHALDGGRASSAMEKEAVAAIAAMFGWSTHLGHLTSGGTVANLEALWVAGMLHPGKAIAASSQAHYTHARVSAVLRLPFRQLEVDRRGLVDLAKLEAALATGTIGTVVATLGTTSLGGVDPLPEILDLARAHGVRVHVDAAYGGYFRLADGLPPDAARAFARIDEADSIVVDPHKHGGQPYGCGCVLFRDPSVGSFYQHDSPYTYFSSAEHHLGEITLECSRPGAAAVALWATQRLRPLVRGGALAADLTAGLRHAARVHEELRGDPRFVAPIPPTLDIVVWAPRAPTASETSRLARRIYEEAAREHLHLALTQVPRALVEDGLPDLVWDAPTLTCLRACLMRPEHATWHDAIRAALSRATDRALDGGHSLPTPTGAAKP